MFTSDKLAPPALPPSPCFSFPSACHFGNHFATTRTITLSIFAKFSSWPTFKSFLLACPHSRRASLIIPSVIIFVSQLVISHSPYHGYPRDLPHSRPSRPACSCVRRPPSHLLPPQPPSSHPLDEIQAPSLSPSQTNNSFDAIRPPVQRK